MTANRLIFGIMLVMALALTSLGHARMVHDFDCSFCHEAFTSEDIPYMTYNVCLDCHYPGKEGTTYPISDGSTSNPITATFAAGDGSNAMGSNAAPGAQTSHFFAGSAEVQPAAGASAPADWRFSVGWARGLVTCSRCHNPHGDTSNPKLLKLGAGKADAMCLACHKDWDQQGNHGRGTHPMHSNYPALAAANPEKFKVVPGNFGTSGGISLVDDVKVSCSSCHGVHWTDSDASTPDGKTPSSAGHLNAGDGKLLKFDGPGRENPDQSLCQTCHSYDQHGRGSGLGCMVCHGGHEYDPGGNPNYFILKKQVELALVPKTEAPGTVSLDYTIYPAPVEKADGVCLECHNLPVSHDAGSSPCSNCHYHKIGFAHGDGNYGTSCLECHTDDHATNSSQANWVTIFDNTAGHSYELGSPPFTVDAYATCSLCHETNVLTPHADNCALCHTGASPPRDSFADWNQTCQQGSCHASYHAEASDLHDDYYYNAKTTGYGDCNNCHGASFDIPWAYDPNLPGYLATHDACNKCHTTRTDSTPPLSYTDLKAEYIDTALIKIWANDATAVRTLYYRIDGGTTQSYTPPSIEQKPIVSFEFQVSAPTEGSQTHTLEFWAADTLGNEESPNLRTFLVTKDIQPPVTTSDAKLYYGSDAVIHLTATDNATSFAVTDTYWVLDDPEGTPNAGTTAVIPEPTSDSQVHTLYFWSVDHAGNIENPPKSASFTMFADGQENTVLYLDQTVGFYTDEGASGPSISYTIYINDEPQVTLTKTAEGPATTTWNCPSTIIEPGGDIDIVVDAKLANYTGIPDGNAPYTYSFTLPEGAVLLEASTWRINWNMQWEPVEYEPGYGDFAYVEAMPGTIENVVYVTASPDTTPPVTTSNVESGKTYFGSQNFTLSASDPGGTGVAGTWWQLDSTTGSWTSGTSISVPEPASGTLNHTLYWYSVDRAGNVEATKSVAFTMTQVSTEVTALSVNEWVGLDTETGASGPWASYRILLDGIQIGSFSADYASPSTATNQTFNWPCPETEITGEGRIDIIVQTGYTNHGVVYWTNSPRTYSFILPEGAEMLEAASWTGFPKRTWDTSAYDDEGYPYAYVGVQMGTISNIKFATTSPDTTAPVTTSNVVSGATYVGNQTFNLTPSDPGGTGAKTTRWKLDSGIWQTGTQMQVPAPASAIKAHTLYWYSEDYSGNRETEKSISFSVEALGSETTSLDMGTEAAYVEAEEGATGPSAHYTIYADGDFLGSKTANTIGYWDCPGKVLDEGDVGLIEIFVTVGLSSPGAWYDDTNKTKRYSMTLPAGAKRIEATRWYGFKDRIYVQYDYNDEYDYEHATVTVPTGPITNITYARTGSDTDSTAPATAINAQDGFTYYGDQSFTLAPDDFGGSGIESTWWQLDGGDWHIGTSITVTAPASGDPQETHIITWYSRDNVANQEAQQSITIYLQAGGP